MVGSALAFSVAGVLTKAIQANTWTIACWRGLVGGLLVIAYVTWKDRKLPVEARYRLGWRGWLLALVGGASSLAFIAAFKLTYIANVAVIYATAPFLAAALGWCMVREGMRWRTAAAGAVSLAGVCIVVGSGLGSDRLLGDAVALLMTLGCALYMVMIRTFRDCQVVLAGGVSAVLLFLAGLAVIDPLAVSGRDVPLLLGFGVSFAVALVLWTEGTRLIPASESGFLGTVETPFAILLAWIFLAELPPPIGLAGGAVVLAAVFVHAGADVAQSRALTKPIVPCGDIELRTEREPNAPVDIASGHSSREPA